MFQTLTQNLSKIFDKLKSSGALTDVQIDSSMREIRIALLEADVSLPVIKKFIEDVSIKAKGQEVIKSISPGQMIIKIINDELISLLDSGDDTALNLSATPPASILIVGLQGSGKTTASSKLAKKLKNENKKILLVSLDIYRPAAQEQLQIMAGKVGVDSLEIIKNQKPLEISERAIKEAKLGGYDVVIYDSAGRLHIDEEMIDEVSSVKKLINPVETLLVIDSMTGQDAVIVAENFNQKLGITGTILSRIDGDSRGGAALSVRFITNKPIKFLSNGENPDDFMSFDAASMADRILDKGDIVSFVEKATTTLDQEEAEKVAKRLKSGKFNLNDYIKQLKMIKKMGGVTSLLGMVPGMSKFKDEEKSQKGDEMLKFQEAIYNSMTKKERRNPDLLNASRRKRVGIGSGTSVQEVNKMMKQFKQVSSMMKKASKMNPASLLKGGIDKLFS